MADRLYEATAVASGAAVIQVQDVPKGLLWIVQQISVSTNVFRVGATCVVKRNASFITNTALGSADSAYRAPALLLSASDTLFITWAGLTVGDQAQACLFYEEYEWSNNPTLRGVV